MGSREWGVAAPQQPHSPLPTPGSRVAHLARDSYDIVVIGGGAYGAFAAWDAALRGLRVALVERGDFGGETSANSLKIVHGGLRHLQSADLARVREGVRERAILLRAAPHLVRPLPCVLPTAGRGVRSRPALAAALAANDLLSADRNLSREPSRHIPRSRLVSREELARLAGPLAAPHATGAALWCDALMESPERLLLAAVRSAVVAGARVANYVEVTALLLDRGRVAGVRVRSADDGEEGELHAGAVLNAAGPWASRFAGGEGSAANTLVRACNLVVRREGPAVAVAVPSRTRRRMLFAVPWRGRLLLGTSYRCAGGAPQGSVHPEPADVDELLADFNDSLPQLGLQRQEVVLVHAGLLPGRARRADAAPLNRPVLVDHARADARPGLVTVQGVKWTTARAEAARAVDLCQRHLAATARHAPPAGTDSLPLFGGDIQSLDAFWAERPEGGDAGIPAAALHRLKELYGTEYHEVLSVARERPELARPLAEGVPVVGAQVVHAVREEMARHLTDVVLRRTELGTAGYPGDEVAEAAARLAGAELGWSPERERAELGALRAVYHVGTS